MRRGIRRFLCENAIRQHRAIGSADLSGSFAPVPQFQKREIHTVFPRFRNARTGTESLAELPCRMMRCCHINQDIPVRFVSIPKASRNKKNFLYFGKKVLAILEKVCYYIQAVERRKQMNKSGCGEVWYRA